MKSPINLPQNRKMRRTNHFAYFRPIILLQLLQGGKSTGKFCGNAGKKSLRQIRNGILFSEPVQKHIQWTVWY